LLQLAFAAELLAAAVLAGVPTAVAAQEIGHRLGGRIGGWLCAVGRHLTFGALPSDAWRHLEFAPSPAKPPVLQRLRASISMRSDGSSRMNEGFLAFGRLMAECESAGISPRMGLRALAKQWRADVASSRLEIARKAGVAVVGPLGLCFLPAFVLVSVVPVAAAAVQQMLQ